MVRPMGLLEFAFAIAPNQPLAQLPEPLSSQTIWHYRAIAAADSSRQLAPRSRVEARCKACGAG